MVCSLIHFPSQAEWPHVGPNFFNISQAFGLRTGLARIRPAKRAFLFGRPDRVLLFMIYNDFVRCLVFLVVRIHLASFIRRCGQEPARGVSRSSSIGADALVDDAINADQRASIPRGMQLAKN